MISIATDFDMIGAPVNPPLGRDADRRRRAHRLRLQALLDGDRRKIKRACRIEGLLWRDWSRVLIPEMEKFAMTARAAGQQFIDLRVAMNEQLVRAIAGRSPLVSIGFDGGHDGR